MIFSQRGDCKVTLPLLLHLCRPARLQGPRLRAADHDWRLPDLSGHNHQLPALLPVSRPGHDLYSADDPSLSGGWPQGSVGALQRSLRNVPESIRSLISEARSDGDRLRSTFKETLRGVCAAHSHSYPCSPLPLGSVPQVQPHNFLCFYNKPKFQA